MSSPNQHTAPNSRDRGTGQWPADFKWPINTAPVPQKVASMPVAHMIPNGWMPASGTQPAYVVSAQQQHMAGHFGMVHHPQQHDWAQYAPYMVMPPMTPPNTGAVYDAHGRNRGLPQAHAHQIHAGHGPQAQYRHMVYVNPNHANLAHLRAQQQSEDAAMQKLCARLSLEDTEKLSVAGTASATATATVDAQVPTQHFPNVNQASIPAIADTTTTGGTELTVVPGTKGPTRIILGPDGTSIVPPPDPAHPGCELSVPMANALDKFSLPHCCDYLVAKDHLRDKVSARKVLTDWK